MRLVATPLSHFSRKVRILLDLYSLPYEFVDIGGFPTQVKSPQEIGNNPIMKVPVLFHDSEWLLESDHIASYIVQNFDSTDKYNVNSGNLFDLNARAMMNGVMQEEVKIIGARRGNVPQNFEYFKKAQDSVENGLDWLESNQSKFDSRRPSYREFHLVCLWDHLEYMDFVPNMEKRYSHLNEIVNRVSESTIIRQTAPRVLKPK
jgi:glutathione S-transferase